MSQGTDGRELRSISGPEALGPLGACSPLTVTDAQLPSWPQAPHTSVPLPAFTFSFTSVPNTQCLPGFVTVLSN